MKKTIGVFAHVDAGKTTFSEQVLYHAGMLREIGRVDHKNAALDTHEIEKKRGITVFSDQAYFTYKEHDYYWIDTPGHVDFSPEMERAIGILDYAVVIISAVDGVQGHTERVFEYLTEARVPVLFFINKTDVQHADTNAVMQSLVKRFADVIDFNGIDYQALAEYSEILMEAYFEDRLDASLFLEEARELFKRGAIYPVLSGSALKSEGIDIVLERLHQLTETNYQEGELAGLVYKVKYVQGVRHAFIKLTGGTLKVRDCIDGEKVTGILKVFGNKMEQVREISAGDIAAVTGLSRRAGESFGTSKAITYQVEPVFRTKLSFDVALSPKDVFLDMKVLEDEDPSLRVTYS